MKSMFEVNGKNRFENNKKMNISVYGVRTAEYNPNELSFLYIFKNVGFG